MDCYEIEEVSNQARLYRIKCKIDRIGTGEEFEYKISFSEKINLEFTNQRAAMLFIDAIIKEHKLVEHGKPYRVGFGWEIS